MKQDYAFDGGRADAYPARMRKPGRATSIINLGALLSGAILWLWRAYGNVDTFLSIPERYGMMGKMLPLINVWGFLLLVTMSIALVVNVPLFVSIYQFSSQYLRSLRLPNGRAADQPGETFVEALARGASDGELEEMFGYVSEIKMLNVPAVMREGKPWNAKSPLRILAEIDGQSAIKAREMTSIYLDKWSAMQGTIEELDRIGADGKGIVVFLRTEMRTSVFAEFGPQYVPDVEHLDPGDTIMFIGRMSLIRPGEIHYTECIKL